MQKQECYKLSDICDQICDGVHNTVIDTPTGDYYLLSAKNIKNRKITISDDERRISSDTYDKLHKRTQMAKGDILLTTVGASIGDVAIVRDEKPNYEFQRSVGIFKPKSNVVVPDYLFYIFQSESFQQYLYNNATGAAQPCLFLGFLKKIKVSIPEFSVQQNIVDGIYSYDKLIENNSKRISLLEQMAENLYKEWFVRFRFPGHENAEFDESNPRGWIFGDREITLKPKKWHFGELKELGEFVRGKNITADKMVEGNIAVISAGLYPSGYHNEANVFGKSLTISASGANAGYLLYHLEDIWAADCSYYQNKSNIWFVYNSLKFLQPVISNMQAGAAQPHVYPKHVNRISMIIPEKELIDKYCEIVSPIYNEIKILKCKNDNLINQRNLLLPRLMSGKLEVK